MKPRKVHREAIHVRRRGHASCGATDSPLSAAQFRWIPREYQCGRCLDIPFWWGSALGEPKSATFEMQTIVETIVLAIHRIAECPVALHDHVWLPYVCGVEGVDPKLNPWRCTCGAFSRDGKTINASDARPFYGIDRSVDSRGSLQWCGEVTARIGDV